MDEEKRTFIEYEKAIAMLPDGKDIHTFRSPYGMLMGADFDRQKLLKKMKNHKIELSGKMATNMNHGIVLIDKTGPLFIETKRV